MQNLILQEKLERVVDRKEVANAPALASVTSLSPRVAAKNVNIAMKERDKKEAANILLSIRLLLDASIPEK